MSEHFNVWDKNIDWYKEKSLQYWILDPPYYSIYGALVSKCSESSKCFLLLQQWGLARFTDFNAGTRHRKHKKHIKTHKRDQKTHKREPTMLKMSKIFIHLTYCRLYSLLETAKAALQNTTCSLQGQRKLWV